MSPKSKGGSRSSRYVTPDLEGNTIAYKGRRYWLVELAEDGAFQSIDTSIADYVVFDRLENAPIGRVARYSRVARIPGAGFEVSTIMGFAVPEEVDKLREAVTMAVATCWTTNSRPASGQRRSPASTQREEPIMPNKHISELPEEYHDRLHFLEAVTQRAANYMFEHDLKEDPGDTFDPPLWEMWDALRKLPA